VSDILSTVILGIIEGISEFLPISSTGHLLIAERWLGGRSELFNVAIQAGAILALVLIYWRRLLDLLTRFDQPANRDYLAKLTVAFLITAAGGFLATRLGWKLRETVLPIALALVIGGIAIFVIEAVRGPQAGSRGGHLERRILGRRLPDSRGGVPRHLALRRDHLRGHARRSHAASGGDRVRLPGGHPDHVRRHRLRVAQGARPGRRGRLACARRRLLVSGVVAFIAVKWLLRYVQSHRFTIFAWYRVAVGTVLLALVAQGTLR